MEDDLKTILVIGATGKQGSHVVQHLLSDGWFVRGLTRNTSKPGARQLARMGVEIITADLRDDESVGKALEGVYGVYYMLPLAKWAPAAGLRLAEQAQRARVQHLVFSSVGGAERDVSVAHFVDKQKVENRIKQLGMPATILRPVAYMDALANPRALRLVLGFLKTFMPPDKKFQMIALEDIGAFAAQVFSRPEYYIGKSLELAGDEMTVPELEDAIRDVTGQEAKYYTIPKWVIHILPKIGREMIQFYAKDGWKANINALRKLHPEMLTFKAWLEKERLHKAG